MERDTRLDPDDLNRPDWNGLKSNYDKHDIGEAYLTGRLEEMGVLTENWGIDMRDDDDSGLIFDDKMDLRLWEPRGDYGEPNFWPSESSDLGIEVDTAIADGGLINRHVEEDRTYDLKGVCDIKTKANPRWLGKFNLRHLSHYAYWADNYDVPVFLYFTMVDMEEEEVGEKNIFVEVPAFDNYYDYVRHFDHDTDYSFNAMSEITDDCEMVERAFRAPDGNPVISLDDSAYRDFDYVCERVA